MTRASDLLELINEKETSIEFEFWVDASDAKETLKVMRKVGLTDSDFEDSVQKIKGMSVWSVMATELVMQNLQSELSTRDINSWREGEGNERS